MSQVRGKATHIAFSVSRPGRVMVFEILILPLYRACAERTRVVIAVLIAPVVPVDAAVAPAAGRAYALRVPFDRGAPDRSGSSSHATRWRARYSRVVIVASGAP